MSTGAAPASFGTAGGGVTVLLVCRFAPDDAAAFLERARVAVPLLAAQPGCRGVELGPGVDEPDQWVLVARFDSVTAYRRALGPFDVREHVVPWLAEAATSDPAVFERRLEAGADGLREHASLRLDGGGAGGVDGAAPDRRAP